MSTKESEHRSKTSPALWLLPGLMLIAAVLPLPYGYYTLLRIVVSLAAAFICYSVFIEENRVSTWTAVFGFLALLFNPIIPVYLSRETWFALDLAGATIFFMFGFSRYRSKKM